MRAARCAIAHCPQLPLAHWLAATVFVARGALDQAERDVGRAGRGGRGVSRRGAPFRGGAALAEGTPAYRRRCNRGRDGVVRLGTGPRSARTPLCPRGRREHLVREGRVPECWRPRSRAGGGPCSPPGAGGLAILDGEPPAVEYGDPPKPVDDTFAWAARLAPAGESVSALRVVSTALTSAPPRSGRRPLAVEPLLRAFRGPSNESAVNCREWRLVEANAWPKVVGFVGVAQGRRATSESGRSSRCETFGQCPR